MTALKCAHSRRRIRRGRRSRLSRMRKETGWALGFSLAIVSKTFCRLRLRFIHHNPRNGRRRNQSHFEQHIRKLLHKAFLAAIFRTSDAMSAKRRDALTFVLAAASMPSGLQLLGVPAEVSRQQRQEVRR